MSSKGQQRRHHQQQRRVSALTCWSAYIISLACITAGVPVIDSSVTTANLGPIAKSFILGITATVIVYLFSFAADNSSVYDPFWCILPLWLGFYYKSQAPGGFFFYEPRETICLVLLWVWAVRFFYAIPWDGWTAGLQHEDWRYEKFREFKYYWVFSLSSLHLTPTFLVFFAFTPVARVLLQGTSAPPLNVLDAVAALLTISGIVIEAVADHQLQGFRRQCANSGNPKTCHIGLWRWSRHPNYFGECTFWMGLLAFGISSGAVGKEPVLATGALLIWIFFRFASVPLMDERSLDRRRHGYAVVMETTSPLLLWPPR